MEYSMILDTSSVINLFNNKGSKVVGVIRNLSPSEVLITSITRFELHVGSLSNPQNLEKIAQIPCISLDCESASLAARIFFELQKRGQTPGIKDCFIAAIAITNDYLLISNDRDFIIFEEYGLRLKSL